MPKKSHCFNAEQTDNDRLKLQGREAWMLDESCLKWSGSAVVIGCDYRAVQKLLKNELGEKILEFGERTKTIYFNASQNPFSPSHFLKAFELLGNRSR